MRYDHGVDRRQPAIPVHLVHDIGEGPIRLHLDRYGPIQQKVEAILFAGHIFALERDPYRSQDLGEAFVELLLVDEREPVAREIAFEPAKEDLTVQPGTPSRAGLLATR